MKEGLTPSKIDKLLLKIKPHPVVALVDDDPATLDLLDRALRDEGYLTSRFNRAEELMENFSEIQPDAIVMEVVLPGMSGLSVLDQLRPKSLEAIVPVLILSQRDDPRTKLLAFRRGALDYVTKPFNAEEVAARVRALIRAKRLQEMLRESSVSDPLTSVYNARFLSTWLLREIERAKRYRLPLSCLRLDLDGFHRINEENGERFGDFLLRELAGIFAQNTRGSDILGRIENDEFLFLLPGTSKEEAMTVARRLREKVQGQEFGVGAKRARASFCMGIVGCDSDKAPDSPEVFLEKAEEALRKAKTVGVNQTAVLAID